MTRFRPWRPPLPERLQLSDDFDNRAEAGSLKQARPGVATPDHADRCRNNAKYPGDFGVARFGRVAPDLQYLRGRQPSAPVFFSSRGALLVFAIAHVVVVSAKKKMIGADARRVVALVQNPHAISDSPVCQYPGDVVRHKDNLPRSPISDAQASVAVVGFGSGPSPASITDEDFAPKSSEEPLIMRSLENGILMQHLRAPLWRKVSGVGSGANRYPFPVILAGAVA